MKPTSKERKKTLIVWGNWGPYHYARFRGFKKHMLDNGFYPVGLELFPESGHYNWETNTIDDPNIYHLNLGSNEASFPLFKLIFKVIPLIWHLKPAVVFVPSYWHWSLFINFVSRFSGAKIIMMNETHGGSEKATGLKKWIKTKIVQRFHGALVGGQIHKQFFTEMGIPEKFIEIGYDAIDNEFFAEKAKEARANAIKVRTDLGLPNRYYLSLSRIIEKKNLPRLIEAFSKINSLKTGAAIHLVIVGSGNQEQTLRLKALSLKLPIVDHMAGKETENHYNQDIPAVHFYGFRQIYQNPLFYALADCFVMPSIFEEWGLVANEAMACSIPCITSSVAGCAEDLIIENETGYKVPWDNVNALYEAMNKFNIDPSLSSRLGEKAYDHIQKFGCDFFGSQSALVSKKILDNP